jgi:hypothetical protein
MSETALVITPAALGLVRVCDDRDAKLIVALLSERLGSCLPDNLLHFILVS